MIANKREIAFMSAGVNQMNVQPPHNAPGKVPGGCTCPRISQIAGAKIRRSTGCHLDAVGEQHAGQLGHNFEARRNFADPLLRALNLVASSSAMCGHCWSSHIRCSLNLDYEWDTRYRVEEIN